MVLLFTDGCSSLTQVNSKQKYGVEWRHKGEGDTDDERYGVQQGLEFKFANGLSTTLSYRRRDVAAGAGEGENAFFLNVGFPLWKKKAESKKAEKQANTWASADTRIRSLERRIEELETRLKELSQ